MGLKTFFTTGSWNNTEVRSTSSSWLSSGMWESNKSSKSGVSITKQNALSIAGVYSAVKVITDAISQMPIQVIKNEGDNRIKDDSHPVSFLLSKEPNKIMTSTIWRQIIVPHILLWGNSYNIIEFEKGGSRRPKAIMPVHPSRVKVKTRDGLLYYVITRENKQDLVLDQSNILHFRGMGNDVVGMSVIDVAADNLGVGKAAEDFGARFFGNGASMTGVLQTDEKLSDKAFENLSASFNSTQGGLANAHKPLILEEGLKYTSTSIPPDSAQFLQTREFSISDIARWFTIPQHKIGDMSGATFSNIEEQSLSFVKDTLMPYIIMFEQEMDRKLFRLSEKRTTYTRMNVDGLLRGDIKTRTESYKNLMQVGAISPNEIRNLEDMNPYNGGDSRFMQTNAAPIKEDGTNQTEETVEQTVEEPQIT